MSSSPGRPDRLCRERAAPDDVQIDIALAAHVTAGPSSRREPVVRRAIRGRATLPVSISVGPAMTVLPGSNRRTTVKGSPSSTGPSASRSSSRCRPAFTTRPRHPGLRPVTRSTPATRRVARFVGQCRVGDRAAIWCHSGRSAPGGAVRRGGGRLRTVVRSRRGASFSTRSTGATDSWSVARASRRACPPASAAGSSQCPCWPGVDPRAVPTVMPHPARDSMRACSAARLRRYSVGRAWSRPPGWVRADSP